MNCDFIYAAMIGAGLQIDYADLQERLGKLEENEGSLGDLLLGMVGDIDLRGRIVLNLANLMRAERKESLISSVSMAEQFLEDNEYFI